MPKNIVIFSDGTGQEGGNGTATNVYRLFNAIENRTPRQIAYYDRGLGTGFRKLTGNVGGMGITKNILDCYQFIFDNYQAGDEIYLFGFSRGATTMRSLSNFIHLFGMLPKSRPELIKKAYKIYKTRDKAKRDAAASNFVDLHNNVWTRIKFVGVWDTVAALGVPNKTIGYLLDKTPGFAHRFQDISLHDGIDNAYHALAVDDRRKAFHPTLFENPLPHQAVKQVWFCGMHTDVGGGYDDPSLSNIPFEWMKRHAVNTGLLLFRDKTEVGDPDGRMEDSRSTWVKKRLFAEEERTWKWDGKPVVHQSVVSRRRNESNEEDPGYKPWILQIPHDVDHEG